MQKIGFRAAKAAVLAALVEGDYQHAARDGIDVKNLLALGEVSAGQVEEIIRRCNGSQHQSSAHHRIAGLECHVIKAGGWYIKFYFLQPTAVFISVHLQG